MEWKPTVTLGKITTVYRKNPLNVTVFYFCKSVKLGFIKAGLVEKYYISKVNMKILKKGDYYDKLDSESSNQKHYFVADKSKGKK